MSNAAEVRRLDFVNTLRRRLRAGRLRVNLAAQARDNRARMVNRLRRNSTSSSSEAARLPQPITARDKGSRKVGRRNHQKKRHRHGRNNFGAITPAAPERENSGAAFFVRRHFGARCSGVCVKRRALAGASAATTNENELR